MANRLTDTLKQFNSALRRIIGALFDPMAVIAIMTTLGLIVATLVYAGQNVSRTIVIICFVIGGVELITMVLQIVSLRRARRVRAGGLGGLLIVRTPTPRRLF